MRRPLAVIGLSFFVALWCFAKLPEQAVIVCTCFGFVALIVTLLVRSLRKSPVWPCVALALLAAGTSLITAVETSVKPVVKLDEQIVTVTCHMTELVQMEEDAVHYTVLTDTVEGVPMRVPLSFRTDSVVHENFSDVLVFKAKVRAFTEDLSNVHLYAYHPSHLTIVSHKATWTSRMLSVRQYIKATLGNTFPDYTDGVLQGLLTGDTAGIPKDTYARIRNSGMAHIFAVSGLHLSVFSFALIHFLERLKAPRWLSAVLPIFLVLFFIGVTGCSKSCLRAGIMLMLMLIGRCFLRKTDSLNSLGLAALLIGLADPLSVGGAGLSLSMLGCISVTLTAPFAERVAGRIVLKVRPFQSLLRAFVSTMVMSACIALFTMPITALEFRSVSIVAPLANACLLWAAEWAMILTAVGIVVSVLPGIGVIYKVFLLPAGLLARYCVKVAGFFGGFAFSAIRPTQRDASVWIAGTLLMVALTIFLRMNSRRKIMAVSLFSLVLLLTVTTVRTVETRNGVQVHIANTGDNTTILLESRGESMLIGSAKAYDTNAFLIAHDCSPDSILLPDYTCADLEGLSALVQGRPGQKIYLPGRTSKTEPLFFFGDAEVVSQKTFHIGLAELEFFREGDTAAGYLTMNGNSMLLLFSPGCDVSLLPQHFLSADLIYARADLPPILAAKNYGAVFLSCDESRAPLLQSKRYRGAPVAMTADGEITLLVRRDGTVEPERGV